MEQTVPHTYMLLTDYISNILRTIIRRNGKLLLWFPSVFQNTELRLSVFHLLEENFSQHQIY